jgi:hypothetical protein
MWVPVRAEIGLRIKKVKRKDQGGEKSYSVYYIKNESP